MNVAAAIVSAQKSHYQPVWACQLSDCSRDVAQAASDVITGMARLDLDQLGISPYNQRYLQEKFAKPAYEACVASYMLSYLLDRTKNIDLASLTLVDFGAGSGLVSLIAKRLGIGNVVFCDIFEQSCIDGQRIAESLDLVADHYVCGDLKNVATVLTENQQTANAVCSHNVIEHVYDMNELFADTTALPHEKLYVWHSTSANPARPKSVAVLSGLQRKVENEDREAAWGHKERNALRSYRAIRRDMITNQFPEVDAESLDQLVTATRGLRKDHIHDAVKVFQSTGALTVAPEHETNTCDPNNGNWCERLMDPFKLVADAHKAGLKLEVAAGLWSSDPKSAAKSAWKRAMNVYITLMGHRALRYAPYYILRGSSGTNRGS